MRKFLLVLLLALSLTACGLAPTIAQPPTATQAPTFTPIPTFTSAPQPTAIPADPPPTITLDFIAQLCSAKWSNGAHYLVTCPPTNVDRSGGYAMGIDPLAEGLPAGTPALLTVPAWNGSSSLFLRYPNYAVHAGDRFRTNVFCSLATPQCDVQFALEYYDANGKYQELFKWNQVSGQAPTVIDADLSMLANQTVDFTLVLRLFHILDNPQQDHGIWVAPHIYRSTQ